MRSNLTIDYGTRSMERVWPLEELRFFVTCDWWLFLFLSLSLSLSLSFCVCVSHSHSLASLNVTVAQLSNCTMCQGLTVEPYTAMQSASFIPSDRASVPCSCLMHLIWFNCFSFSFPLLLFFFFSSTPCSCCCCCSSSSSSPLLSLSLSLSLSVSLPFLTSACHSWSTVCHSCSVLIAVYCFICLCPSSVTRCTSVFTMISVSGGTGNSHK